MLTRPSDHSSTGASIAGTVGKAAAPSVPGNGAAGRIGPNAITRMGEALRAAYGSSMEEAVFLSAGLSGYLHHRPEYMVPEWDVRALHDALRARLPLEHYRSVSWQAGLLTGDYLLAHRIPRLAQQALAILPRNLAGRALLTAITRHAWTFAGSGEFRATSQPDLRIELHNCPLCRGVTAREPVCDYFAGTFTRIWSTLIDPQVIIRETHCGAVSPGPCIFEAVREPQLLAVKPPGHGGAKKRG